MSTNARPAPPRRKVIVAPKVGVGAWLFLMKVIIVWMLSAVLHAGMIAAFVFILMFVSLGKSPAGDAPPEAVPVTQVEEDNHDADLTNIDIGSDPTLQLNY